MEKKQTILIVEDNHINRKILVKMLSNEYEIVEAVNGQDAVDLIMQNPNEFAAILLDIIMPIMSGYEVLEFLSKENITHIPIVVMTGELEGSSEEKALDLGAWDFISKPYRPRVLLTRMKNAIARSKMSYLEQIRHIAEHDQLTNIYNRRHFFEVTDATLQKYLEGEKVFVRMDIKRFRLVNSFFGEKGGDDLLIFISNEIQKVVEKYEWCVYGRIESDVFGMCIPFSKEIFDQDIEYLTDKVKEYNKEYLIEPSFGVYIFSETNVSAETMFLYASLATEKCKNKYMVYVGEYDPIMTSKLLVEEEITKEMRHALENREFVIYYQPKYETKSRRPCGAEALVRWCHPQKGMIPPGDFVPVFEQNGFIGTLDVFIWEQVCIQIRKWLDKGLDVGPISVNMSRAELTNPMLVELLSGLIEKYQVPVELLNLELTETAYIDNPDAMNEVIRQLHQLGFLILMDDFGSGYSSLNTLKDLDVDILKIDMKFLSLDESNTKSRKILASVVGMAQWINIPVITEGVETEEQYEFLKEIGCEYIQGYYFSKPMPVEEFEQVLEKKCV